MTVDEIIQGIEPKVAHPKFRVGDTLRVHVRIREGEKERIQVFEGVVIKRRRGGRDASFIVRKVSYGVGVERMFHSQSPSIEKIEIVQKGKARRARLFYLRDRRGKDSAIREDSSVGREGDAMAVPSPEDEPDTPSDVKRTIEDAENVVPAVAS